MTPVSTPLTALFFAAMLGAPAVAAPRVQSSAILSSVEVQRLAASTDRADAARLEAHFETLAARYAAEASRHDRMATAFGGNPTRTPLVGMSDHCKRLAALGNDSAVRLRELAAHYRGIATGEASSGARDESSSLDAGEGAPVPTDQDVAVLAASVRTAADHLALAQYFTQLSNRSKMAGTDYRLLAQTFRETKMKAEASACERLAILSEKAAKEAAAAAARHREMANQTR